jgi:hypothetical protein
MTALDIWLKQATRHLAKASAALVRTEIQEHYESAREAAMSGGASTDEAELVAMTALGDPVTANCQYRNVLLTSAEARLLREGNWEARAVCSRPWLKGIFLAIPVAMLLAAVTLFLTREIAMARDLFAGGIAMGLLLATPFLPIYTPRRSRAFRFLKWVTMIATLVLIFGPDTLKWSWLLISCLWPWSGSNGHGFRFDESCASRSGPSSCTFRTMVQAG